MTSRNRQARDRRMAFSHSQPSYIRPNKLPLILPQIKPKHAVFYQEITLSPDFVRLPASPHRYSSPQQEITTPHSPTKQKILVTRPKHNLYQQYSEQDRVVQRYEEQQQNYQKLVQRISKKWTQRHEQEHKKGVSLIYDRLMGLL